MRYTSIGIYICSYNYYDLFFEGFCFAASKSKIPAGTYTLVVSTYEANQIGNFLLTVASSVEVERPVIIPAEGEGMCTRKVTGSWSFNEGTAVGCSNYGYFKFDLHKIIDVIDS